MGRLYSVWFISTGLFQYIWPIPQTPLRTSSTLFKWEFSTCCILTIFSWRMKNTLVYPTNKSYSPSVSLNFHPVLLRELQSMKYTKRSPFNRPKYGWRLIPKQISRVIRENHTNQYLASAKTIRSIKNRFKIVSHQWGAGSFLLITQQKWIHNISEPP